MRERAYQQLIEKNRKIIVFLFFLVFLFIGFKIYKDYGVHWDEYYNQSFGNKWASYVHNVLVGNPVAAVQPPKFIKHDWIHGPAFEIFLVFIQKKILNLSNSRDVIFMRHLCTFLLFYASVYFFYLLCKLHFKSWKISLLGSIFLILSPRIFADSFYNTVDIPFLSLYIISMYTLLRLLDKKTFARVAIHAFICALLIAIRATGIFLPLYTILILAVDILRVPTWEERVKGIKISLLYISLLIMLIIIFWPLSWSNTLLNLIRVVKQMKSFTKPITYLYFGKFMKPKDLPWHYAPVWIVISTPIFYSFCFFVGCFALIKTPIKNSIISTFSKRNNLLFALWFFLPLLCFHGKIYNGWRHSYFIYPAFLIFSLTGLIVIWEFIKIRPQKKILQILLILAAMLNVANVVYFMVRYHPYQNVYFNSLAGRDMQEIKSRFELDYWGLSYRKALEYILKNDKDEVIKIYVATSPGENTVNILTEDSKKRLLYVKSLNDAKYFLSDYEWHPSEYLYKDEFFSIKIGEAKIMVVYKLK